MTLRYLKVTQPDLQRKFYKARQNTAHLYHLPALSFPTATADLPGIRQALAATRHLLEMYRRQLSNDRTRRRLLRLDRRLLDVAQQLQNIGRTKNDERLAGQSAVNRHPVIDERSPSDTSGRKRPVPSEFGMTLWRPPHVSARVHGSREQRSRDSVLPLPS